MYLVIALLLAGTPHDVWSSDLSVGPGQTKVLKVSSVKAGEHYQLVTRGQCVRTERGRYRRWREKINPGPVEPFGVEFRLTLGDQSFPVDVDEHTTLFRASEANPELRVEDRSSPAAGVRCTLTHVAIRSM